MSSTNYSVSALVSHIAENKELLIKDFALVGNGTRARMSIQPDIKYKGTVNILDLAPTIQDGSDCGFSAAGTATLSNREIVAPSLKINMEICEKNLIGKWGEWMVKISAKQTELPFEAYVAEGLTNEINKSIEKIIWQGNTTPAVTGLLATFTADVPSGNKITNGGTSVYTDILAVYNKLPEEVLDKGAEIYVSPAKFRTFMQELVAKNLYHYEGAINAEPNEFILPGSNAKVVRTQGLAGKDEIVGTFASNLVYGCDTTEADIDLWYSQDDRIWKLAVLWNQGMQVAFPDMVVVGA